MSLEFLFNKICYIVHAKTRIKLYLIFVSFELFIHINIKSNIFSFLFTNVIFKMKGIIKRENSFKTSDFFALQHLRSKRNCF